jgi:ATP-binding cassette subfamily F protein 3
VFAGAGEDPDPVLEAALRALEDELADPKAWASPTSSERATQKHAAAKKAVEEAYARWEAASA